jgi:3',5'-cyclic AMP phosphodiesterase CpdA
LRILHLTDLHFTVDLPEDRVQRAMELVMAEEAELIVCTGDIVSRANEADMRSAFARARRFREATGVRWLSVPGNHDLYDIQYNFIPSMYAEEWEVSDHFAYERHGVRFVGINSGHQDPSDDPIPTPAKSYLDYVKYGDVSKEQVRFADEALGESGMGVLCLHHHLIPIWNKIFGNYYNGDIVISAALLLEVLRKRDVRLVLGGHKHSACMNVLNGTVLINGGSLLAPLPNGAENCFNVIDLDSHGALEVEQVDVPSGNRTRIC